MFNRLGSSEDGRLHEDQLGNNSIIWVRDKEDLEQGRDKRNGGDEGEGERFLRWSFIYSRTNKGNIQKRQI